MLYFYCTNGTDVQGPIPAATLKDMYSSRQLPSETKICAEGGTEWQDIQMVLRTLIAAPAPPHLAPQPTAFKTPTEQIQPTEPVSPASIGLLWIPAMILAVITAGLVAWPIAAYIESEESAGRLHPPDWLVKPAAFAFIGLCFFLTRVYITLFLRKK